MTVVLVFTGVLWSWRDHFQQELSFHVTCWQVSWLLSYSHFYIFADLTNFKILSTHGYYLNGPTERLGAGNQHIVKGGSSRDVIVKFDDTAAQMVSI